MTKTSRQKGKYLENKKSFGDEIKNIFHHFQRAFSGQKLSQAESAPLKKQFWIFWSNLPENGISSQNQKKLTSPSNSAYAPSFILNRLPLLFLGLFKNIITTCDKKRKFPEFQINFYRVWQKVITKCNRYYKMR